MITIRQEVLGEKHYESILTFDLIQREAFMMMTIINAMIITIDCNYYELYICS